MKPCALLCVSLLALLALVTCSSPTRTETEAPLEGDTPEAANTARAAVPPHAPTRVKVGELGADEWVDVDECGFGVDVSAKALSYVIWVRRDEGRGRLLTSTGDIPDVDELLVMHQESGAPAGRYRYDGREYVFAGSHRAGPYGEQPYYETWNGSVQTEDDGRRWAYWYESVMDGRYYLASSYGDDLGPLDFRPVFKLAKGFFLAQLPGETYYLDGKPLDAQEVLWAGETLAYTTARQDGTYLVIHGVAEKGPFQSIGNLTVTEEGWAAVGRYADGTARLVADTGDAYPIPDGHVDHLSRGGADTWGVVFRRDDAFVLWSPERGEQEPVVALTCTFFADPGRTHTLARYRVEGEHRYFLRELGESYGPYQYCKTNDPVPDPTVTANGWVTPPVMFDGELGLAYRFGEVVTFIPGGECEVYEDPVARDARDVAFATRIYGEDEAADWVYWKGTRMGPYRDVVQLAIHSGELIFTGHDEEGSGVLHRNGEPELTFAMNGAFLISRDGSSNLFAGFEDMVAGVYVNGAKVGEGLIYARGETVVGGEPHWYWLSQEGSELYLYLDRFPG